MLENIVVIVAVAAALIYVVSRFIRTGKPGSGCGCCSSRSSCPSADRRGPGNDC
ncbi:FeoB-associated Cys-rich membrane protein [Desulfovibrio aminophilus]|uniref:FeoB-associated Cys-rich membrane protein n=1 Tax=Desulfovibrio aminophilus TaxID=81425 RepID=UPI003395D268